MSSFGVSKIGQGANTGGHMSLCHSHYRGTSSCRNQGHMIQKRSSSFFHAFLANIITEDSKQVLVKFDFSDVPAGMDQDNELFPKDGITQSQLDLPK